MLGFMPRLYNDELLYSWMARYHLYSGNGGPKQSIGELIGNRSYSAVPDLPTQLKEISQQVQDFTVISADELVSKHTFFHYYSNFIANSLKEKVHQFMITGNAKGSLHFTTGVMASSIKENTFFKYCPSCVTADIEMFGETYWRRNQQLPGMMICLQHHQWLQNSLVRFRPLNKHAFIAATVDNCPLDVEKIIFTDKEWLRLKEIAVSVDGISNSDLSLDIGFLQKVYTETLKTKGLANVNGTVDQPELAHQFEHYYGSGVLACLQSELKPADESCWLKAITRKHRKSFHPIRHLLLLGFLGIPVASVDKFEMKFYKPFGDGPFPCLNPATDHFQLPIIQTANVEITICSDTKKPAGTFSCECGFIYSRKGPDVCPEDMFRIGRIKSFGSIWHSKLHQYLAENKSYREVARLLQVDTNTIIKYAKLKIADSSIYANKIEDIISQKQNEWIQLQKVNPGYMATELRKSNQALYSWLYRSCKKWLLDNTPKGSTSLKRKTRVDWATRDDELAIQLSVYITSEWSSLNRPKQVTVTSLGKSAGNKALIEKHLDKLPRSRYVLENTKETSYEFQIRKAFWATHQLEQQNEELVTWKVQRIAGATLVGEKQIQLVIEKVKNERIHI